MDFKKEFISLVKTASPDWEIKGFITADKLIYALGSDTKVLSTAFELLCKPFILKIAEKYDYQTEEAPQTVYPDFTLLKKKSDKNKIAIDIKTTYRKFRGGCSTAFNFTLGSYTSFIRNNTKNILYPYSDYKEHWIIGFVYTRNPSDTKDNMDIFKLADIDKISSPYKDVTFFVQKKYKIAGLKPGSGNTTNIGSIKTGDLADFEKGRGPFAKKGEKAFLAYWKKYKN